MPDDPTHATGTHDERSDPAADAATSEPMPETPPSPQEDEQIFCPVCDYNLTGNLTGRCSECGATFDRDQLIEARRRSAEALMPWERAGQLSWWQRFWRTTIIGCIRPDRFALALSARPTRSHSATYFLACLGVVCAYFLTASAIAYLAMDHRGHAARETLRCDMALLATIVTATYFMALGLAVVLPMPHRPSRVKPWVEITHYAASHWMLIWACLPCIVAMAALLGAYGRPFVDPFAGIFTTAATLLWIFTLTGVIRRRLRSVGFLTAGLLALALTLTLVVLVVVFVLTYRLLDLLLPEIAG